MRVFYGWWIVLAASLILSSRSGSFTTASWSSYPSMVDSLGFARAQVTQGFLVGFVVAALLFGILAGVLIDRLGTRQVIRVGIWFAGLSLGTIERRNRRNWPFEE